MKVGLQRALKPLCVLLCCGCALWLPKSAAADEAQMQVYGVAAALHRSPDYRESIDELIASGVKWVRIGADWNNLELSKGVWNQDELDKFDEIVNRLHAGGINMVWILSYTAGWASTNPSAPDAARYPPANWNDWRDFVAFIVDRYNGKIHHWEAWNEPDIRGFWRGSVGNYYDLLRYASQEVRARNAANVVLLGGLAFVESGAGSFFDQLMRDYPAASEHFDVLNYHAYGNSRRYLSRWTAMELFKRKYRQLRTKPIWITETGYSTVGDDAREEVKADLVEQTSLTHLSFPDVERAFWYGYRNQSFAGVDVEQANFGLVDTDREPLKAFYNYQANNGAELDAVRQATYPPSSVRRVLELADVPSGDGSFAVSARHAPPNPQTGNWTYLYYRVNDSWMFEVNETPTLDLTYHDVGSERIYVQYDANGNNYQTFAFNRGDSGEVVTRSIPLADARFANGQNNLADFRIVGNGGVAVVSATIRRADGSSAPVLPLEVPSGDGSFAYNETYIPSNTYLYLTVQDAWLFGSNGGMEPTVYAEVTYLDQGSGRLQLQYGAEGGAYRNLLVANTGDTGQVLQRTVALENVDMRNRQNHGADLRLHAAGGGDARVRSVVLFKDPYRGWVRLSAAPLRRMVEYITGPQGQEDYNPVDNKAGVECRRIDGANNNRYFYFDVAEGLANPLVTGNSGGVDVTITFWDAQISPGDNLRLQYDSLLSSYASEVIEKTGTQAWRTVTISLPNARFRNSENFFADMRIGNNYDGSDEFVSHVQVDFGPYQ